MDLMGAVLEMAWYNWVIFLTIVIYIVLWVIKIPVFADPEKRFMRIRTMDSFYEMGDIGLIIFHIRNGVILAVLVITFRISMM